MQESGVYQGCTCEGDFEIRSAPKQLVLDQTHVVLVNSPFFKLQGIDPGMLCLVDARLGVSKVSSTHPHTAFLVLQVDKLKGNRGLAIYSKYPLVEEASFKEGGFGVLGVSLTIRTHDQSKQEVRLYLVSTSEEQTSVKNWIGYVDMARTNVVPSQDLLNYPMIPCMAIGNYRAIHPPGYSAWHKTQLPPALPQVSAPLPRHLVYNTCTNTTSLFVPCHCFHSQNIRVQAQVLEEGVYMHQVLASLERKGYMANKGATNQLENQRGYVVKSTILQGCVITSNGISEGPKALKRQVLTHGGRWVDNKHSRPTHILQNHVTPAQARVYKKTHPLVVQPAWLLDSLKAGVRLQEHLYFLEGLKHPDHAPLLFRPKKKVCLHLRIHDFFQQVACLEGEGGVDRIGGGDRKGGVDVAVEGMLRGTSKGNKATSFGSSKEIDYKRIRLVDSNERVLIGGNQTYPTRIHNGAKVRAMGDRITSCLAQFDLKVVQNSICDFSLMGSGQPTLLMTSLQSALTKNTGLKGIHIEEEEEMVSFDEEVSSIAPPLLYLDAEVDSIEQLQEVLKGVDWEGVYTSTSMSSTNGNVAQPGLHNTKEATPTMQTLQIDLSLGIKSLIAFALKYSTHSITRVCKSSHDLSLGVDSLLHKYPPLSRVRAYYLRVSLLQPSSSSSQPAFNQNYSSPLHISQNYLSPPNWTEYRVNSRSQLSPGTWANLDQETRDELMGSMDLSQASRGSTPIHGLPDRLSQVCMSS